MKLGTRVFDNSPKMVAFKQRELIRAMKFVVGQINKSWNPQEVFQQATSQYGFSIGFEAFKRIITRIEINNKKK